MKELGCLRGCNPSTVRNSSAVVRAGLLDVLPMCNETSPMCSCPWTLAVLEGAVDEEEPPKLAVKRSLSCSPREVKQEGLEFQNEKAMSLRQRPACRPSLSPAVGCSSEDRCARHSGDIPPGPFG